MKATIGYSLEELQEQNKKFNDNWKAQGKKTTTYKCPCCKKDIEVRQPNKTDVSSKGYWDSAKICVQCGEVSFVIVRTNGKITATHF